MNNKVELSNSSIIRLILIILGLAFLFYIRDILVLLFIVLILVAGLSPTVDRWARYLTRVGAVTTVFLLIFLMIAVAISLIIPPFIEQLREFSIRLPFYVESLSNGDNQGILRDIAISLRDNLSSLSSQLGDIGSLLLSKTFGVISGVVAVVTVFVMTFYLLLEEKGLQKIYKGVFPDEWHPVLAEPTTKILSKLGAWMRGQLLLMLVVGIAVTIGLFIIGSPYALTLGIWAGLTEAIPIVGPLIGAAPGVLVGWAESPLQGILSLIVYTLVQQLENNFLVPKIMSKAVGLNPVIVIIAILIGGKLYGVLGVLLSVPLAAIISVLVEEWPALRSFYQSDRVNHNA